MSMHLSILATIWLDRNARYIPPAQSENKQQQKGKLLLVGMLVFPECLDHKVLEKCLSQPVMYEQAK